jgi:hypothetical protein
MKMRALDFNMREGAKPCIQVGELCACNNFGCGAVLAAVAQIICINLESRVMIDTLQANMDIVGHV